MPLFKMQRQFFDLTMNKIISLIVCVFVLQSVIAQNNTNITFSNKATQIGGITLDTIYVVKGSTNSFQ